MTTMSMTAGIKSPASKIGNIPYQQPYQKTGIVGIDAHLRFCYLLRCTDIFYAEGVIHFSYQGKQYQLLYRARDSNVCDIWMLIRGRQPQGYQPRTDRSAASARDAAEAAALARH